MEKILFLFIAAMASVKSDFGFTFNEYKRTSLGDSVDIASMKILKETYDSSKDKSVVASPLGVLTLLSLYAAGAEGKTREEIMNLLGSKDYKQISDSYSELSERFASMDSNFLTLANKIFVSEKLNLAEEFLNTARSYHSEVDNIDFTNQKSAAEIINKWSSSKTHGEIKHPVSASDIDSAAAVALLNVIFFQGHWHVPFNASETKEKEFHLDRTTSVQKPMMHLLRSLFYRENQELGAKMIELPYKESKFRMIVVLPNEIDGLPSVLEKAAQKGLLNDIFHMMPARSEIDLDMPKFEIKSKLDLNDILPKVGVSALFSSPAEGVVRDTGVVVARALQDAFVRVDEEGATAGAFTGLVAVPMSSHSRPPPPMPFKVDRPFLFAILHDDITLFAGTYSR